MENTAATVDKMTVKTDVLTVYLHCLFIYVSCAVNPALVKDCVSYESYYHFERACKCVVYESFGRNEGIFTSPNFPQVYASDINCILYTFIGDFDEIVELTFIEFDLQPAVQSKCSDFLKFFLDLSRPEVNEFYSWDYELCAGISTVQKKHYSSQRSLILEFHTDSVQRNNTGFRGRYKFLEKAELEISGGSKVWGSECAYDFHSSALTRAGRLFSPKYPQNYPARSDCQYVFHGQPNERVNLTFLNIQLQDGAGDSCDGDGDRIVVHDGHDSSAPVMVQYCGRHNNEQTISSSEILFVRFVADDDGRQQQGFAASFRFFTPRTRHSSDGGRVSPTTGQPRIFSTKLTRNLSECVQRFSSVTHQSGVFTTPSYPEPYLGGTRCRYLFEGRRDERVAIAFTNLDLYYPHGDPDKTEDSDCTDVDSVVSVYVTIDGKPVEIGVFCGRSQPPMLMSSSQLLEVRFQGRSSSTATGFRATYEFVTDFGIKVGHQNRSLGCGFTFRSKEGSNGTFTSPNYPGHYPRNTECHYLFYGQKDEKIYITFKYFHVEGFHPCTEVTKSDYVEFSNFNIKLTDRQMGRICGSTLGRSKRTMESDGNFFRVTFKANGIYDAHGFEANYQFLKKDEDSKAGGKRASLLGSAGVTTASWTSCLVWLPLVIYTS